MGSAAIKVIKKSSADQPRVKPEKSVKNYSKNAIHSIESNIKGWIEELQVRKNDELLHSHSFLSGA